LLRHDVNQVLRGNTLCNDGDVRNRLRRVVIRPVTRVQAAASIFPMPSVGEPGGNIEFGCDCL